MANSTTNYNLTKPLETDYYDINIYNSNMDVIDNSLMLKVDKVEGKGLSSNDFTNEEKEKLSNCVVESKLKTDFEDMANAVKAYLASKMTPIMNNIREIEENINAIDRTVKIKLPVNGWTFLKNSGTGIFIQSINNSKIKKSDDPEMFLDSTRYINNNTAMLKQYIKNYSYLAFKMP